MSQKKKMLQRFTWLTGKLNASFDSTISGRGSNNHSIRESADSALFQFIEPSLKQSFLKELWLKMFW